MGPLVRREPARKHPDARKALRLHSPYPSHSTHRYLRKGNENTFSSRKNSYTNVYGTFFIISLKWRQPTCLSTREWINKLRYYSIVKQHRRIAKNKKNGAKKALKKYTHWYEILERANLTNRSRIWMSWDWLLWGTNGTFWGNENLFWFGWLHGCMHLSELHWGLCKPAFYCM